MSGEDERAESTGPEAEGGLGASREHGARGRGRAGGRRDSAQNPRENGLVRNCVLVPAPSPTSPATLEAWP